MPCLTLRMAFLRTPKIVWYDASPEAKSNFQRLIYPINVGFTKDGFSNPSLGLPFMIINDIAASSAISVDPRGFEPLTFGM